MSTKNESRGGNKVEAQIIGGGTVGARARMVGRYAFSGVAPFLLRRGDAFVREIETEFPEASRQFCEYKRQLAEAGRLHFSTWSRLVEGGGDAMLRFLDRFVEGGGDLLFAVESKNLWVDVGLNFVLDTVFRGSTYTAANYVGLTAATPSPAAGDTMSSHAGWTENTTYSEGVRQTYTAAVASGKSTNNSANKATFSINGTTTVGGAFVTTNNTKGGTTGTLLSATALTGGNKALSSGDSLLVTSSFSQADDGV